MRRHLIFLNPWRLLAILLIATALASYAAWVRSVRPAQERPVLTPSSTIPLLTVEEAHALWHKDSTLFVDTRTEAEFELGHIAGALLLPEEEFDWRFGDLKERLVQAENIVVYCKNLDCGKSLWTAIRLHQQGLAQSKIFPAGWKEWQRHGYPRSSSTP